MVLDTTIAAATAPSASHQVNIPPAFRMYVSSGAVIDCASFPLESSSFDSNWLDAVAQERPMIGVKLMEHSGERQNRASLSRCSALASARHTAGQAAATRRAAA